MTNANDTDKNSTLTAQLAKLCMPRLALGITRPRLFQVLDEGRKGAAVWIAAPGGTGKTTLAATYLLERKLPYLWYQLDQDDADPATFFYYLGIAAKHAVPDQDIFLPLLTPEYLPDIPGFARRYFRDLFAVLPPGVVLVMDNYQDLGDVAIFSEIVRSAIGEILAGASLLVISRTDPPPELAHHPTTGAVAILDWEAMRLTHDETRAIVAHHHPLDGNVILTLHERAEGWPAGVTLLLEHIKRKGINDWAIGKGSPETVFQFFASEFFNDLPETTRDFLLKTSLLSHMTPALAAALTGNSAAGEILADLHRRHFFTNRRDLEDSSYQYHALFREFLYSRAVVSYTQNEYLALTRLAGRLLSENARHEEAVTIYLQTQDWEMVVPLLLSQAPQLLSQGRAQIVAGWIQQMPETLVKSTPWLLYWNGISQMSFMPLDALESLRRAHARFDRESDAMGRILTASAIIDIIYLLRQSLLSAAPWLNMLQKELALNPHFPSPVVESRILTSTLSILTYTRPQDLKLPQYADRLAVLLDSELDVNQKVVVGAQLVHYYALVAGDLQACERIATRIRPLLISPKLTALNQIMWRTLSLPYSVIENRKDKAYETILPVLTLVEDNSLHFMESIAKFFLLNMHHCFDDITQSKPLIERIESLTNGSQPADLAWAYVSKTIYALKLGDYPTALSCGETSLRLTAGVAATLIEMDISCLMAIASCESGRIEEAFSYLAPPRKFNFGNSPRICSQAYQVEAYTYLQQGDLSKCHPLLREAFSIAGSRGYFGSWLCWNQRMMSRLCAEALRAGIEVEYVRHLIRKRKLVPEDPAIESWPWPVRIYTLGQFRLLIDDQPLAEIKTQRKPLVLLQILIALGGEEVKIDRIAEILWPDAEGDAASSAFTTTLSRLRKLIGDDALSVKGGRVSLDARRCWVDVRALEYRLDRTYNAGADVTAARESAEKLLALYHGPFLSDEEGEWPRRLRDRLRTRLLRGLQQCIDTLRAAGEGKQCELIIQRAIDADAGLGHL